MSNKNGKPAVSCNVKFNNNKVSGSTECIINHPYECNAEIEFTEVGDVRHFKATFGTHLEMNLKELKNNGLYEFEMEFKDGKVEYNIFKDVNVEPELSMDSKGEITITFKQKENKLMHEIIASNGSIYRFNKANFSLTYDDNGIVTVFEGELSVATFHRVIACGEVCFDDHLVKSTAD